MNKGRLARPSITSLFKNQGIYSSLIGVFLFMIYLLYKLRNHDNLCLLSWEQRPHGVTADKRKSFQIGPAVVLFEHPLIKIKITSTFYEGAGF